MRTPADEERERQLALLSEPVLTDEEEEQLLREFIANARREHDLEEPEF